MFVKRSSAFLTLLFATCLCITGAHALDSSERSLAVDLPLQAGGSLKIENLLGSVTIRLVRKGATPGIKARVTAEAKGQEAADSLAAGVELMQTVADGVTTIHVLFPTDEVEAFRPPKAGVKGFVSRWAGPVLRRGTMEVEYGGQTVAIRKDRKSTGLAVHLTVTVPVNLHTSVYQAAGAIDARYMRGDLELETETGRIDIISSFGNFDVTTAAGDVRIASCQGNRIAIRTGSGQIDLEGTRGDLVELESDSGLIQGVDLAGKEIRIRNGSGDVRFADMVPVTTNIHTESGNIEIALRIRNARGAEIGSDRGDITLRMSEKLSFDLTAVSKSGQAKTHGMRLDLQERNGVTENFRQGSGGMNLTVTAPQGGVTIRPYDSTRMEILTMRLEAWK